VRRVPATGHDQAADAAREGAEAGSQQAGTRCAAREPLMDESTRFYSVRLDGDPNTFLIHATSMMEAMDKVFAHSHPRRVEIFEMIDASEPSIIDLVNDTGRH
jgi:hypothetical protein